MRVDRRKLEDRKWKFLAVWIVLSAILLIYGIVKLQNSINDNKENTKAVGALSISNKQAIHELQETKAAVSQLRRESIRTCVNYVTLRDSVNSLHGALRKDLKQAIKLTTIRYKQTHQKAFLVAIKTYKELLDHIHLVTRQCNNKIKG
jgi:hypothetical protein